MVGLSAIGEVALPPLISMIFVLWPLIVVGIVRMTGGAMLAPGATEVEPIEEVE